jgi:hypothetical protein
MEVSRPQVERVNKMIPATVKGDAENVQLYPENIDTCEWLRSSSLRPDYLCLCPKVHQRPRNPLTDGWAVE